MLKKALKYFYRSGDLWVVVGILIYWGALELSGYLHKPWIFAIGMLALVVGGLQYTLRGTKDDRVVTAEKSAEDNEQAEEKDRV